MAKATGITAYSDRFGLVQPYAGEPAVMSRYGPLQTVEWFFTLTRLEQKQVLPKMKTILSNLEIETENGVVTTCYPNSRAIDTIENVMALIVFSELFDDGRFSNRLYRHGELVKAKGIDSFQNQEMNLRLYPLAWIMSGFSTPKRFYNARPEQWSFDSWWGRFPFFTGILELAAINRTSFINKTFLWLHLFACLFPETTLFLNKRTAFIIWSWLKTRGQFWRLSFLIWNGILKLMMTNGVISIYRTVYAEDHPINL